MQRRHLGITDLDVISHASLLYLNACIKNVIGRILKIEETMVLVWSPMSKDDHGSVYAVIIMSFNFSQDQVYQLPCEFAMHDTNIPAT